ncbi:HIT family protein [Sediminibacter sp. Hel_I_10]|uniref:HIT family protein n=1 Tax=Sediminibacter sp. Hel_I_10 TaxID=1392490 RepID=UPI00056785D3|nr:HIT family protein [Sediminibacter sp. Hel_I_10]
MKDFLEIPRNKKLYQGSFFFIIEDAYPVSPGHLLIVSNDLNEDFFELSNDAKLQLPNIIDKAKTIIEKNHSPNGYNIGMNCGLAAGQTIFHFHCHIIPRYKDDIEHPEGGVRGVIPSKMMY